MPQGNAKLDDFFFYLPDQGSRVQDDGRTDDVQPEGIDQRIINGVVTGSLLQFEALVVGPPLIVTAGA